MYSKSLQVLGRAVHTYNPRYSPRISSITNYSNRAIVRTFSSSKMSSFPTPSIDRPKHEMQYFPDMLTALPSKSAEFRRVLWTGELYPS